LQLLSKMHKSTCLALIFIIIQGIFCFAQTKQLLIDKEKSQIKFKTKHLGVLIVNGVFEEFSGTVLYGDKKLKEIKSKIQVKSINTLDESRDKTLLNNAYLDERNYPLISFKSSEISNNIIKGLIKIKNVEKEIELNYNIDEHEVLSLKAKIRRDNFNLHFGTMNSLIGNEIVIEIKIITKIK